MRVGFEMSNARVAFFNSGLNNIGLQPIGSRKLLSLAGMYFKERLLNNKITPKIQSDSKNNSTYQKNLNLQKLKSMVTL